MSMTLKFTHIGDAEAFDDLEATTEDSGKRVYKTPSGISYPSVTTVVGFKKRAFFAEWRRKNPEESRRVLSRGNTLHSVIEDYLATRLPTTLKNTSCRQPRMQLCGKRELVLLSIR